MKTFKQFVYNEDNVAGVGGVFGTATSMDKGGSFGNSDFYAPGDARIPSVLGSKKIGKKKKVFIQRRPRISN